MTPAEARLTRTSSHSAASRPIATFFGGVQAPSPEEEALAFQIGRELGTLGFELRHGGYNGLMEEAARGAASLGTPVVAVTLSGKEEWGAFNPYITESVYAHGMGPRLAELIEDSDIIVAMAGGVGSLHELTAALWYSGNIRRVPVVLLGETAQRLVDFLRQERWLYETPTRPLDFLHAPASLAEARQILQQVADAIPAPGPAPYTLEERVRRAANVEGRYALSSGEVLSAYFDPFRLTSDPTLSAEIAAAMARKVKVLPDAVAGLALGGVALATDLSRALDRPLFVIRPQPKLHGTFAQIEGTGAERVRRVLILDDVVRSGRQMLNAVRALHDAEMVVTEAMCVLERSDEGRVRLKEVNIDLHALYSDPGSGRQAPSDGPQPGGE